MERASVEQMDGHRDASLRDYLAALRRHKLIFVLAVVLVPAVAWAISAAQQRSYQATAEVLIGDPGSATSSSTDVADRLAQTQVSVARVPLVAARALRSADVRGETAASFLARSSVAAKGNANVLEFSVTDREPLRAQTLVNAYAREFTDYEAELDAAPFVQAIRNIRIKLATLERDPAHNSLLIAALRSKQSQLETEQQVQSPTARLLRTATEASQVSPRPKLYLLLGAILGLVLGSGLAVLADMLDGRVRSSAELVDTLGLPLLGVVPLRSRPPDGELAVLGDPSGAEADAVRMLRSRFVLANLSHRARTIMFASAASDDGKAEAVANLAVSMAKGRRRVTLVDCDFRDPVLQRLLGTAGSRGLADVLSGTATLEEALVRLVVTQERTAAPPAPEDAAGADGRVELEFLPAGSPSSRPAELAETDSLPKLLDALQARSDVVLVNAPPLLRVSDGIELATMVDAVVLVSSARRARRSDLAELRRVLESLPPPTLGLVLTDAGAKLASTGSLRGPALQASPEPAVVGRSSDVPASM